MGIRRKRRSPSSSVETETSLQFKRKKLNESSEGSLSRSGDIASKSSKDNNPKPQSSEKSQSSQKSDDLSPKAPTNPPGLNTNSSEPSATNDQSSSGSSDKSKKRITTKSEAKKSKPVVQKRERDRSTDTGIPADGNPDLVRRMQISKKNYRGRESRGRGVDKYERGKRRYDRGPPKRLSSRRGRENTRRAPKQLYTKTGKPSKSPRMYRPKRTVSYGERSKSSDWNRKSRNRSSTSSSMASSGNSYSDKGFRHNRTVSPTIKEFVVESSRSSSSRRGRRGRSPPRKPLLSPRKRHPKKKKKKAKNLKTKKEASHKKSSVQKQDPDVVPDLARQKGKPKKNMSMAEKAFNDSDYSTDPSPYKPRKKQYEPFHANPIKDEDRWQPVVATPEKEEQERSAIKGEQTIAEFMQSEKKQKPSPKFIADAMNSDDSSSDIPGTPGKSPIKRSVAMTSRLSPRMKTPNSDIDSVETISPKPSAPVPKGWIRIGETPEKVLSQPQVPIKAQPLSQPPIVKRNQPPSIAPMVLQPKPAFWSAPKQPQNPLIPPPSKVIPPTPKFEPYSYEAQYGNTYYSYNDHPPHPNYAQPPQENNYSSDPYYNEQWKAPPHAQGWYDQPQDDRYIVTNHYTPNHYSDMHFDGPQNQPSDNIPHRSHTPDPYSNEVYSSEVSEATPSPQKKQYSYDENFPHASFLLHQKSQDHLKIADNVHWPFGTYSFGQELHDLVIPFFSEYDGQAIVLIMNKLNDNKIIILAKFHKDLIHKRTVELMFMNHDGVIMESVEERINVTCVALTNEPTVKEKYYDSYAEFFTEVKDSIEKNIQMHKSESNSWKNTIYFPALKTSNVLSTSEDSPLSLNSIEEIPKPTKDVSIILNPEKPTLISEKMEEEELSSEVEGTLSPEIELEGDDNAMNFSSEVESCNSISPRMLIDIQPIDFQSGEEFENESSKSSANQLSAESEKCQVKSGPVHLEEMESNSRHSEKEVVETKRVESLDYKLEDNVQNQTVELDQGKNDDSVGSDAVEKDRVESKPLENTREDSVETESTSVEAEAPKSMEPSSKPHAEEESTRFVQHPPSLNLSVGTSSKTSSPRTPKSSDLLTPKPGGLNLAFPTRKKLVPPSINSTRLPEVLNKAAISPTSSKPPISSLKVQPAKKEFSGGRLAPPQISSRLNLLLPKPKMREEKKESKESLKLVIPKQKKQVETVEKVSSSFSQTGHFRLTAKKQAEVEKIQKEEAAKRKERQKAYRLKQEEELRKKEFLEEQKRKEIEEARNKQLEEARLIKQTMMRQKQMEIDRQMKQEKAQEEERLRNEEERLRIEAERMKAEADREAEEERKRKAEEEQKRKEQEERENREEEERLAEARRNSRATANITPFTAPPKSEFLINEIRAREELEKQKREAQEKKDVVKPLKRKRRITNKVPSSNPPKRRKLNPIPKEELDRLFHAPTAEEKIVTELLWDLIRRSMESYQNEMSWSLFDKIRLRTVTRFGEVWLQKKKTSNWKPLKFVKAHEHAVVDVCEKYVKSIAHMKAGTFVLDSVGAS